MVQVYSEGEALRKHIPVSNHASRMVILSAIYLSSEPEALRGVCACGFTIEIVNLIDIQILKYAYCDIGVHTKRPRVFDCIALHIVEFRKC